MDRYIQRNTDKLKSHSTSFIYTPRFHFFIHLLFSQPLQSYSSSCISASKGGSPFPLRLPVMAQIIPLQQSPKRTSLTRLTLHHALHLNINVASTNNLCELIEGLVFPRPVPEEEICMSFLLTSPAPPRPAPPRPAFVCGRG